MHDGALADMSLATDPFTGNRYTFAAGTPVSNIELDGHMFPGGSQCGIIASNPCNPTPPASTTGSPSSGTGTYNAYTCARFALNCGGPSAQAPATRPDIVADPCPASTLNVCAVGASWVMAAVRYSKHAKVDPWLALGIAIKESSGRGSKYGFGVNEAFNELGVVMTNLGVWPGPGGASIEITNIKPQVFNTIKNAFPSEFRNTQWANLVGNDSLDFKATAYYVKYLQEKLLPQAPAGLRSRYTSDQIIEGIYNGGEANFTQNVIPTGQFGPVASGYINSIAPDVAVAQSVICQSGAYTCTAGVGT